MRMVYTQTVIVVSMQNLNLFPFAASRDLTKDLFRVYRAWYAEISSQHDHLMRVFPIFFYRMCVSEMNGSFQHQFLWRLQEISIIKRDRLYD